MFGVAMISAISIGYLTKGKLGYLSQIHIKGFWLVILSFGVEWLVKILLQAGVMELGIGSCLLHLLTYILLGIVILLNRHEKTVLVMGIGCLLNALVIFANGGVMPVGTTALEVIGIEATSTLPGMYIAMQASTHLKILADIMTIHVVKAAFILSIGDLLLYLGMMAFIIENMHKKNSL